MLLGIGNFLSSLLSEDFCAAVAAFFRFVFASMVKTLHGHY